MATTNVRPPKVRLADEVDEETLKAAQRTPAPVQEPPSELRVWMNHPFTLVGAAFLIMISVVVLLVSLGGRGSTARPAASPLMDEPSVYVLAWLDMAESPIVRAISNEPTDAREARLMMTAGQIAIAAAGFRELQQQRDNLSPRLFRFIPPALENAPTVPEGQEGHLQSVVNRDEAAERAAEVGRSVVENSIRAGVRPSALRDLGARLTEEGQLAMRFARGEDNVPPYPVDATMPSDEASRLVRELFPSIFGESLESARRRAFPPVGGMAN